VTDDDMCKERIHTCSMRLARVCMRPTVGVVLTHTHDYDSRQSPTPHMCAEALRGIRFLSVPPSPLVPGRQVRGWTDAPN